MELDPVCKMEIKNINEAPSTEYKGVKYFFCTDLCKIQFENDPEKFLIKDVSKEHEHKHQNN